MTTKKWQAVVLVDADRLGSAAASERSGVSEKTILTWRKQLATDAELAELHAEETDRALDRYRADISASLSLSLARMRELIPETTVADIPQLLDVVRELGGLAVQSDALLTRRKKRDPGAVH